MTSRSVSPPLLRHLGLVGGQCQLEWAVGAEPGGAAAGGGGQHDLVGKAGAVGGRRAELSCSPAASARGAHAVTAPPSRIRRGTGRPSMVSRSSRHAGSAVGDATDHHDADGEGATGRHDEATTEVRFLLVEGGVGGVAHDAGEHDTKRIVGRRSELVHERRGQADHLIDHHRRAAAPGDAHLGDADRRCRRAGLARLGGHQLDRHPSQVALGERRRPRALGEAAEEAELDPHQQSYVRRTSTTLTRCASSATRIASRSVDHVMRSMSRR